MTWDAQVHQWSPRKTHSIWAFPPGKNTLQILLGYVGKSLEKPSKLETSMWSHLCHVPHGDPWDPGKVGLLPKGTLAVRVREFQDTRDQAHHAKEFLQQNEKRYYRIYIYTHVYLYIYTYIHTHISKYYIYNHICLQRNEPRIALLGESVDATCHWLVSRCSQHYLSPIWVPLLPPMVPPTPETSAMICYVSTEHCRYCSNAAWWIESFYTSRLKAFTPPAPSNSQCLKVTIAIGNDLIHHLILLAVYGVMGTAEGNLKKVNWSA